MGLDFKSMRATDGGGRYARGLETRGNDGYGESSPEVRERTALESRWGRHAQPHPLDVDKGVDELDTLERAGAGACGLGDEAPVPRACGAP